MEPVFGQIKQGRGFRQFLLRGLEKVNREWLLICTGYNLLKLFRFGAAGPGKARRNSSGREAKESPLASRLSRDSQSSCICDRQAWLSSTAHSGCSPIPSRQSLDGLLGRYCLRAGAHALGHQMHRRITTLFLISTPLPTLFIALHHLPNSANHWPESYQGRPYTVSFAKVIRPVIATAAQAKKVGHIFLTLGRDAPPLPHLPAISPSAAY